MCWPGPANPYQEVSFHGVIRDQNFNLPFCDHAFDVHYASVLPNSLAAVGSKELSTLNPVQQNQIKNAAPSENHLFSSEVPLPSDNLGSTPLVAAHAQQETVPALSINTEDPLNIALDTLSMSYPAPNTRELEKKPSPPNSLPPNFQTEFGDSKTHVRKQSIASTVSGKVSFHEAQHADKGNRHV